MTLDIYTEKVKPKLIHGEEFVDQQAMINAFQETKDHA
jgi:hypothetical protein